MCTILPFTTVLLNSVGITHKAFPFYNILQKFCDIFMLLSFLKLSTMLKLQVNLSSFVVPAGVLNISTLCQSSPSAVLGTWCANPNHIKICFSLHSFKFELDHNSLFGSCVPSKHWPLWGLHVFQHWCCFLPLQLLIPTACHCHCQHPDHYMSCSLGLA